MLGFTNEGILVKTLTFEYFFHPIYRNCDKYLYTTSDFYIYTVYLHRAPAAPEVADTVPLSPPVFSPR